MIALALLFFTLLLLLLWLVKLLQAQFDSYECLSTLKKEISIQTEKQLFAKNATESAGLLKEQSRQIIFDKLIYLNKEITTLPKSNHPHCEEIEILQFKQQSLLKSYFTLYSQQQEA